MARTSLWSAEGIPAGPSRIASCVWCPGAGRTSGLLPGCSSHPPSPLVGPEDTLPPETSIPPPISTTSNRWMAADGPVFNRHKSGSQSVQVVHFSSAFYRTGTGALLAPGGHVAAPCWLLLFAEGYYFRERQVCSQLAFELCWDACCFDHGILGTDKKYREVR